MKKNLILIRGVSGSGKTTFGELFGAAVLSADEYFMKDGKYEFNATKLPQAHKWCQDAVKLRMEASPETRSKIVVANTFTTEWEMKPYFDMAKKYGYRVFSVIVENRHGGTNVHDVPAETLVKQKSRFDIKL